MRKTIQNLSLGTVDLVRIENCLCDELAHFISFKDNAIYFPESPAKKVLTFLPEEKTILIPVNWQNSYLGMLRLSGINPVRCRKLLDILPGLLASLLEKCVLKRLLHEDFKTGLNSEEEFFESMENEAANMESQLGDGQIQLSDLPLYRLCKGLVILSWHDGRSVAHNYPPSFYEHVFSSLGSSLKSMLPASSRAAILGRYEGRHEFGVLFNSSGRNACHTLARKLAATLEALEFPDPVGQKPYRPVIFGGHAIYPQDMNGEELRLPLIEQTMRLRDRARLAVRAALQGRRVHNEKIMGFASILRMGGMIGANLGKGRYRVNLGQGVNASVGMRFMLLGREGNLWRPKGQMVILEIGPMDSVATIISMERTGELPEIGDRLIPISHANAWKEDNEVPDIKGGEKSSRLYGHVEFLARFQQAAKNSSRFVFGLARIGKEKKGEIARVMDSLKNEIENVPDMFAPFGINGLAFFIGAKNFVKADKVVENMQAMAQKNDLALEIGLFKWPFLNFARAESEECAQKALEYASLLPFPHTGCFNSMAITIGADRKLAQGDNFGALEDYRLALLADPRNAIAANSMGVCLAALGRYDDARKTFENALENADENALLAKIHYNLAVAHHKTGNPNLAAQHYRKCLKKDKSHVFACLRLGKLSEEKGYRSRARRFYLHAASLSGTDGQYFNAVQRHLARLEAAGNRNEQARGRLHDNLVRNPEDLASLALLAELYLERNLDPALAEMLARKCVGLTPSAENWNLLAMALDAQDRHEEAALARARGRKI